MAKKFYAYFLENEKTFGIVDTWDECKNLVHGKKLDTNLFLAK